jgi:hypothetical protein
MIKSDLECDINNLITKIHIVLEDIDNDNRASHLRARMLRKPHIGVVDGHMQRPTQVVLPRH